METCRKIVDKCSPKIVRMWRVPSKSDPNIEYLVKLDEYGDYSCSCKASSEFKVICSHQKICQLKYAKN